MINGGGTLAHRLYNHFRVPGDSPQCPNDSRTFLNEGTCRLSTEPHTCAYTIHPEDLDDVETEDEENSGLLFHMNHEAMRAIYETTNGSVVPYAMRGLNVTRDPTAISHCQTNALTRWISRPCSEGGDTPFVRLRTQRLLARIIDWHVDNLRDTESVLDVWHPDDLDTSCHANDMGTVGFEVTDRYDETLCWLHGTLHTLVVRPGPWRVLPRCYPILFGL